MNRKQLSLVVALTLVLSAVAVLFRHVADPLEDQATAVKFAVRGARAADTNIVVVYVDDRAVSTLGWPVRRNFTALMVSVLTEIHARAVGVEIMFEDQKLDFPEYDQLLATVVANSGRIVLPAYLTSLVPSGGGGGPPEESLFPNVRSCPVAGSGVHRPMQELLKACAGVGHLNFARDVDLPMFVRADSTILPAFSLEVLRVFLGAGREGVRYDGERVTVSGVRGSVEFDVGAAGSPAVDFPGSISAFRAYPFLEVLKSYDDFRSGRPAKIPIASFRDKAVLVGVIAEGRSQFYRTPVDARTPSLVLHASFLDNALGRGFLRQTPWVMLFAVCVVVGLLVSLALLRLPPRINWIVASGAVALVVAGSVFVFTAGKILFPIVPPLFVALTLGLLGVLLRQRAATEQLTVLQAEKESVLAQLRDREAKLAVLERELLGFQAERSNDRTEELLQEIHRYKEEIRTLASRADDLQEYHRNPEGTIEGAGEFEQLIYERSGRMQPVVEFIEKIASSNAPVLILGESGTGKELVARAIHRRSGRSGGPFVAVNCGALTETLLESELFGHEKGAFTGAVKDRLGRFEMANGGTIFLDEIGEVSENFQVKLLRVLQEGELERVGGGKTIKVDVRVLAATNRELRAGVRGGKFREDLYYRLNVLSVSLPPLRERREDIPLLTEAFLRRESGGLSISRNAMEALLSYEWRGNVRELESVLKRAVLLARAEGRSMLAIKDLTEEVATAGRRALAVEDQILDSLREKKFSRSSVTDTADELGGLSRGTVAEYLRGECLKAFVESGFDLEKSVRLIALSTDPSVLGRVKKRLQEYLENLTVAVDRAQPWDISRAGLRPKTKNLPQKYHSVLEAVAEAYYRGVWKPAEGSSVSDSA